MIAITYYSHHISPPHSSIFRCSAPLKKCAEERKKTPDASNVNEIVLSWKLIFLCETHFFRAIAVFFASKGRRLHYSYSSLSICKRSGIILEEAFGWKQIPPMLLRVRCATCAIYFPVTIFQILPHDFIQTYIGTSKGRKLNS